MGEEKELKGLLRMKPKFKARPWYNRAGDCLEYVYQDIEYRRDRIDETLTVYRCEKTESLVGFQIKGIQHLLEAIGNIDIQVHASLEYLGVFLFAVSHVTSPGPDTLPAKLRIYSQLLRKVGGMKIPEGMVASET